MNFSDRKAKFDKLCATSTVRSFEKEFLLNPSELKIDHDRAVEIFIDHVRKDKCCFEFKTPLGKDFYHAKDRAINCLEMGEVPPRKVHQWIVDCLEVMNVLLIVYLKEVKGEKLDKKYSWAKERDVYDCCQDMSDPEMKEVGSKLEGVYQKRSSHLHIQKVENGQREIKKLSNKQSNRNYALARGWVKDALTILVPRYRKAYPDYCTDQ